MGFNPFASVKNYRDMLDRIGWFTFLSILLSIFFLQKYIPEIDSLLGQTTVKFKFMNIQVSIFTGLSAIIIALFARIFKFHDRISDLLKIRHHYDINYILMTLALGSNAPLTITKIQNIPAQRKKLMSSVFYAYASSGNTCRIDRHLVEMAMDMWGWYWIVVEFSAVVLGTALVLAYFSVWKLAFSLLLVFLVALVLTKAIKKHCVKYTFDQLTAILENNDYRIEVSDIFTDEL